MAAIVPAPAPLVAPRALPAPRLAWALAVLALAVLWLVTMEGGAVSQALAGTPAYLHEMLHDGRHLLGVPCH